MVHMWCCSLSLRVDFFRYTFGNKLYYDSKYKKKKNPQCRMEEFGDRKMAAGSVGKELVC